MANSYTSFITHLAELTAEEKDWVQQELATPEDFDDWPLPKQQEWTKLHGKEPEHWPDFQHTLEGDGPDRWILSLFFQENGNLDQVCNFIQTFLEKFRPKDCHSFEWAFTCSKMRAGEFGGGAAFITAEKQTFMVTNNWLREMKTAWEKANGG